MRPEGLAVIVAAVVEKLQRLVLEDDGQVECGTVSRCLIVLDQRADGSTEPHDKGAATNPESEFPFQVIVIPTGFWTPVLRNRPDTGFGDLPGAFGMPESDQRVQRVKSFPAVVRCEINRRPVNGVPVDRQGNRTAVRKKGCIGMVVDAAFIQFDADCVFGVEQGVQVSPRNMGFGGARN